MTRAENIFMILEKLAELIGPTLKYLIPLLFAYTGGYNIYGKRGGVAGCLATIGLIVGSESTMMIGGMVMGPLGAWIIKKVDNALEGKVKPGLEMLVDNFSLGIVGAIMMGLGYLAIEPLFAGITAILTACVNFMMHHNILPFTPIFVVPGQVLFLNNAINHGIFTPLAIDQAAQTGRSILYLIEANGGNWAGLVLAFCFFGKGNAKKSAPGAAIIQIIGGIGEVSFPYALIKPVVIIGPIIGQIVSLFWLQLMGGGAVAAVSPGSIVSLIAMSPRGGLWINVIAYLLSCGISFAIVALILIRDKTPEEAMDAPEMMDLSKASGRPEASAPAAKAETVAKRQVKKIVFACDAGMGSSAMGASILKTQLTKIGVYVDVDHVSVHNIPADTDVVVTNTNVLDAARAEAPAGVEIIEIKEFLNTDEHKAIAQRIKEMSE